MQIGLPLAVRARRWAGAIIVLSALPLATSAQDEGGVYIAGNGFTFEQAADRALAQNPSGQRFFILALPPAAQALTNTAPASLVALRNRVTAANGVLMVCERDINSKAINAASLIAAVVPVRGWPPPGSGALPEGQLYFPGEDATKLPHATEPLRRLRATCSS